jgi:acyl-CoA synthetase (NDP forming)
MTVDLRPALSPSSIAIVGASERSPIVRTAIENCTRLGYGGAIYPVHPRHDQIHGLRCYPSLSALPRPPDCAMIALGAERATDAVEEAAELGVRSVVLPAGGFAERGVEGQERQRRIVAAARAHGMCVIGPNCMGIISAPDRAAVYIGTIARPLPPGNVSLVAQSGSVAHLVVNVPEIPLARVFSSGNEAALTTCDYLEFLLGDDHSEVIMLHLEAHREPGRLLALAERALSVGKPLVTLAVGRSPQAQAMAQAHSGALATSHRRLEAALRRRGVILCHDMDEWLVTAQLAAQGCRPHGTGLGAVTVSGGEAGYLLDLAEGCGVHFPPLSPSLQQRLAAQFPDFQEWINPADGWDKGPWEEVIPAMLAALADESAVDVLVTAIDVPAAQGLREVEYTTQIGLDMGVQAVRSGKPAVYISLGGGALDERVRQALRETNVPLVGGARCGLGAIAHLAGFVHDQSRYTHTDDLPPGFKTAELERLVAGLPPGPADEELSRRVLAAAGLPLLTAVEVSDEAAALEAAAHIDGPAVLKAVLPGVAHKSDAGAVALRLTTPQEVRAAATRLLGLCERAGVPYRLLVSRYLDPVIELICGIVGDPDWGPFVVLGLGGVLAESLDEVSIAAVPLRAGQAEQLVGAGRLGRVLGSTRRPADLPAVVQLVRRLGWLAATLWQLDPTMAVDLNPVMVLPPGQGAWAADALISRRELSS